MKQVPYTMMKFAVQGKAQDSISGVCGTPATEAKGAYKAFLAISSGVVAGVASAIISHPADTLLSKVRPHDTEIPVMVAVEWPVCSHRRCADS